MEDYNKLYIPEGQFNDFNEGIEDFEFHDINESAFSVHGLYKHVTGEKFLRFPETVAKNTSKSVEQHNTFTAGARIRFKTDSDTVYIRLHQICRHLLSHVTTLLSSGCDVYERLPNGKQVFRGIVHPAWDKYDVVSGKVSLGRSGTMKEIVVNLPNHSQIFKAEIGVRKTSVIEKPSEYKINKPVVFYGSSITHGFCASRPGTAYEAVISRKYDIDFINLGFSGAAKGEQAIADYISGLDMSAFVLDYDHNAPDPEYLEKTHYNFYETVRAKNPKLPIIIVTKPDYHLLSHEENMRRCVAMSTFIKARKNGDNNTYFVDGASFFADDDTAEYTVDGCHPTDRGFAEMAKHIGRMIAAVLNI